MDEQEKQDTRPKDEKIKSVWQLEKESWYDRVPLTVKQLDRIIGISIGLLVVVFIFIFLEAMHII